MPKYIHEPHFHMTNSFVIIYPNANYTVYQILHNYEFSFHLNIIRRDNLFGIFRIAELPLRVWHGFGYLCLVPMVEILYLCWLFRNCISNEQKHIKKNALIVNHSETITTRLLKQLLQSIKTFYSKGKRLDFGKFC